MNDDFFKLNDRDFEHIYDIQHYLYQEKYKYHAHFFLKPNLFFSDESLEFIAKEYHNYKKEFYLLDFDDLLLHTHTLMMFNRIEYGKYSWIQVDEVQDLLAFSRIS